MSEHDLLEVVEIEERSGLSRWGWAAYYAELQGVNRDLMLVARPMTSANLANRSIAGYIVARETAGELHINNVAVREECRRQGIACSLLSRILEEGRRLGATRAFLEVRAGNLAARALYEGCGFRAVARRVNYYSEPGEDAVVMSFVFSDYFA
jgi:ribosomal-protein-alanine N-acetyltransferase